ncbi:MAG: ZIP family zinc transporter [Gemmatimonadetes bacterium]|nr:ZIP family zinc transporter [Gemmatimonadota bacterium]
MPLWLQAGLWGLLAGGALVVGAAVGYAARLSARTIAGIMAFGAGVLISAISFELMGDAFATGGLGATAVGFGAGAGMYTFANWLLARGGAKHRKRSGDQQPSKDDGSGAAIAVGALLDGIPESIAFGLWTAIAILSGLAALAGYSVFQSVPAQGQAGTTALAAGAILAMLVETMIPEAFEGTPARYQRRHA